MTQPNIIFMLTDDLGYRDLGCYGSTFYETPNLDRLAKRSMRFTDGYAACPVCSPTRASLLSGKYPANVGVTDYIDWSGKRHPSRGRLIDAPYIDHLPENETSYAQALRDGGYQTWHVGKWHLGNEPYWPDQHGFDVNIAGNQLGSPRGGKSLTREKGYFAPWDLPNLPGDDVPEGTFLDDYLTDQAVRLIENRDARRPFMLNMWFYLVHTPLQCEAELERKFDAKARSLKLDQIDAVIEGELFPCDHKKHLRVQRRLVQSHPTYAGMMQTLDQNVGKLIDKLEAQGILENTIVIFSSDNGGLSTAEGSPTCNLPLSEGKGWMYEGGTRVPWMIAWPGHTDAGPVSDQVITSPDLYPTLMDMAGLPPRPQQHHDGVSMAPLLQDQTRMLDREAVFWHYPHYGNQGGTPACAVRQGPWKLIEFFQDSRLELYNLLDDVSESRNLADVEPQRTRSMHARLTAWRQNCDAKIPQINPDYQPPAEPEADPLV